jgi:hypothetical protein
MDHLSDLCNPRILEVSGLMHKIARAGGVVDLMTSAGRPRCRASKSNFSTPKTPTRAEQSTPASGFKSSPLQSNSSAPSVIV